MPVAAAFASATCLAAAFASILMMIPLTFSIANKLAFGITAYALLKLVRGKVGRKDWLLPVISAPFVARFVWLSVGVIAGDVEPGMGWREPITDGK